MKNNGKVDEYILESSKKSFGEENIFSSYIPQMERIKRFAVNGITDLDRHDKKVLDIYQEVTSELIERLAQFNIQWKVNKYEWKKIGLLNRQNKLERTQGNIIPKKSFVESQESKLERKKKEFKNQQGSIKVPLSTKKELDALKDITKTKFDYEIIQMLIDSYVHNLEHAKSKRFKLLTEDEY